MFLLYWKQIVLASLLSIILGLGFNKIYNLGYDKASAKYELKISEYNKAIAEKIVKIESTSDLLVNQNIAYRELSRKEFTIIRKSILGKPLYVINDGKCSPSTEFLDAWNAAIKRANQK